MRIKNILVILITSSMLIINSNIASQSVNKKYNRDANDWTRLNSRWGEWPKAEQKHPLRDYITNGLKNDHIFNGVYTGAYIIDSSLKTPWKYNFFDKKYIHSYPSFNDIILFCYNFKTLDTNFYKSIANQTLFFTIYNSDFDYYDFYQNVKKYNIKVILNLLKLKKVRLPDNIINTFKINCREVTFDSLSFEVSSSYDSLETLRIQRCIFKSFPKSICTYKRLKTILVYHSILEDIPYDLLDIDSLHKLDLWGQFKTIELENFLKKGARNQKLRIQIWDKKTDSTKIKYNYQTDPLLLNNVELRYYWYENEQRLIGLEK